MNFHKEYSQFLNKFLDVSVPIRVVFDCSDGTTGLVLKELFKEESSLKPFLIHEKPNGKFPSHGPNPLAQGAQNDLKTAVKKENADLGIIFDADGDRVCFVDDKAREVRSDIAALLMSEQFKGPFVFDVRAGYALRDGLRKAKKKVTSSRVGHIFIKRHMQKNNAEFGGEITGHFYFKDFFFADSGLVAALTMMRSVAKLEKNGTSLSQWIDALPKTHYTGEVNIKTKDGDAILQKIASAYQSKTQRVTRIDGIRIDAKDFWLIVRMSNTEPVLRFILEARDKKVFDRELKKLKKFVKTGK